MSEPGLFAGVFYFEVKEGLWECCFYDDPDHVGRGDTPYSALCTLAMNELPINWMPEAVPVKISRPSGPAGPGTVRKAVQVINFDPFLYMLCNDGSLWWARPSASMTFERIDLSAIELPKEAAEALALDVSLEKARALHRVWRALNDGDCPKCHKAAPATEMIRAAGLIRCPLCLFTVYPEEIEEIERLFAPAMDGAVAIFEAWRKERSGLD